MKKLIHLSLYILFFGIFSSCAKEDDPPLTIGEDATLTSRYAIDAQTQSCQSIWFSDPAADGTLPAYDVAAWYARMNFGTLSWADDSRDFAVIAIRFAITTSNCIAPLSYTMNETDMACLTVQPNATKGIALATSNDPTQILWPISGLREIKSNSSVKLRKDFLLQGISPIPIDPKDPDTVKNCTASGVITILGVTYDKGLFGQNERNVRKKFPFSIQVQ